MTAIFAWFNWGGDALDHHMLTSTLDYLAHYGTEQDITLPDANIALATQSSTTQTHHFPHIAPHLYILADSRLDNPADLIHRLQLNHDVTNAEILLSAYLKWDEACVDYLLGDFVVAIWDADQKQLFLARDFIGARPLYYAQIDNKLIVSSDLDAILKCDAIDISINQDEVLQALVGQGARDYYHPHRTFYNEVYKVPYGHILQATVSHISLKRYWQAPQSGSHHLKDENAYIEALRHLLQQAITDRIDPHAKIGSHLSGGMDSSLIAILAARQHPSLTAFSWSPPVTGQVMSDTEQARIEAICKQEGITCHYVPYQFSVEEVTQYHPEQQMPIESGVMRRAQAEGVTVMLSGWGGDEFASFNGRGYRADLFRRLQWFRLWQTFDWHKTSQQNWEAFWQDIVLTLAPDSLHRLIAPTTYPTYDDSCLSPLAKGNIAQLEKNAQHPRYQVAGRYHNQLRLYQKGHLTQRIEYWAQIGARHGITYRYPLLDKRIVEFAFALPDHLYLKAGVGRYLFRQVIAPYLPQTAAFQVSLKSEPQRIAHYSVVRDFALSRLDFQTLFKPFLSVQTDLIDYDCLEAQLAYGLRAETIEQNRALVLLRLLHTLKQRSS